MSKARRIVLVLTVMGAAVLLAGGVALAAIVEGTDGADNIVGTANADIIDGLAGEDLIAGMAGSDDIDGGGGNDELFGDDEAQTVHGASDTVRGSGGNDRIVGGSGSDALSGGPGDDEIVEGPIDDQAHDSILAGDGADDINSASVPRREDEVICGAGVDEVQADRLDTVADDCERVIRTVGNEAELQPTTASECIFDRVYYAETPAGSELHMNGTIQAGDPGQACGVEIDPASREYTAKDMGQEAVTAMKQGRSNALGPASSRQITTRAANTYTRTVHLRTEDPFYFDVTRSNNTLRWTGCNSCNARPVDRWKDVWAGNPTKPGTHWYVDNNYFPYGYNDNYRYIGSQHRAFFHNWDFKYDNQKTTTYHRTTIFGWRDGDATYNSVWNPKGEAWYLLHMRIYLY